MSNSYFLLYIINDNIKKLKDNMALKRTQLFDKNRNVIYPEMKLKTINGESLFAVASEDENIKIENNNTEYGYASIAHGLNDSNLNTYCYKANGIPQWFNYFWELDEGVAGNFPYMWVRTKKGDGYTYKVWHGNNEIYYKFVKGDILQVLVNSKNKVIDSKKLEVEVEVYKNKEKLHINGGGIVIYKTQIKNELFTDSNVSDSFISANTNLDGNVVFTFELEGCEIKDVNYNFGKNIVINVENEELFITPKLLFINNTATEIDVDFDKYSSLIFDLQYNSDAIALQNSGLVFPFEEEYKRYTTKPILYFGSQLLDIAENDIKIGIDENTYTGTINFKKNKNKNGFVESIDIDIYKDVTFKNNNLVVNVEVENNGVTISCGFLLIGVKSGEGITPKFEIRDGKWCVSYDGGQTWEEQEIPSGATPLLRANICESDATECWQVSYDRGVTWDWMLNAEGKHVQAVGRNGVDANILTIDLTNDLDQVFVDDKNKVSMEQKISTNASIYIGNEKQNISSCNVKVNNEKIKVNSVVSKDKSNVDIELIFEKGVEISENKIVAKIDLVREITDEYGQSYGVEKSINFNIIKVNGKVDNDLVPIPTTIKYVTDPSTGVNILDTRFVSMGVRRREVGTSNNEILLELPKDLSLGYKIDNDEVMKWITPNENGVVSLDNVLSEDKGNMPKQLAEFYLYNSANVEDESSYIDYVSIDCLYDATLPVLYQLSTNVSSLFVDDNGDLSDGEIKLGIKKSIGNSTVHHTTFEEDELNGLYFNIRVNDDEKYSVDVEFSDEEEMTINLLTLKTIKDYVFEKGGYIEISLLNKNGEDVDIQLDNERLYIVRNATEFYNYIVNFSNDAEQVRVNSETLCVQESIEIPIEVEFKKNEKKLNITNCEIITSDDNIQLTTNTDSANSITGITLTINSGFKFDSLNLNRRIAINFIADDDGNTITKMKMFSLYPTTSLSTYELKTSPSYLKFNEEGIVTNNEFNIEIFEKGNTYSKIEYSDLSNKNIKVYASKNGVNLDNAKEILSLTKYAFEGITNKSDITQTTNLCFILTQNGSIIDYVTIESVFDGTKGPQGEPGKDGVDGKDGKDGADGKRGKMTYPAGEWSNTTGYKATANTVPYVYITISSNGADEKVYYMLKDEVTEEIKGDNYKPTNDSQYWEKMEHYESISTDLIVANYGIIGGAVFYDDVYGNKFMFSTQGKNSNTNVVSTDYRYFLKHRSVDKMVDVHYNDLYKANPLYYIKNYSLFVPNVLINFTTGESWFSSGATIFNANGTGQLSNGKIEWTSDDKLKLNGDFEIYGHPFKNIDGEVVYDENSTDIIAKIGNTEETEGDNNAILFKTGIMPSTKEEEEYIPFVKVSKNAITGDDILRIVLKLGHTNIPSALVTSKVILVDKAECKNVFRSCYEELSNVGLIQPISNNLYDCMCDATYEKLSYLYEKIKSVNVDSCLKSGVYSIDKLNDLYDSGVLTSSLFDETKNRWGQRQLINNLQIAKGVLNVSSAYDNISYETINKKDLKNIASSTNVFKCLLFRNIYNFELTPAFINGNDIYLPLLPMNEYVDYINIGTFPASVGMGEKVKDVILGQQMQKYELLDKIVYSANNKIRYKTVAAVNNPSQDAKIFVTNNDVLGYFNRSVTVTSGMDSYINTAIYTDGTIKTKSLDASGVFNGIINSTGTFNGVLNATSGVSTSLKINESILNNCSLYNNNILINEDGKLSNITNEYRIVGSVSDWVQRSASTYGGSAVLFDGEIKGTSLYLPKITASLQRYTPRRKNNDVNTPTISISREVMITDSKGETTIASDLKTYCESSLSTVDKNRKRAYVTSPSYNICKTEECTFYVKITVSWGVYLEHKQGADWAAATLSVYPNATSHSINGTTESSDKIIVAKTNNKITGAKMYAMSDGFIFKSASGAKLVIDANGIKMYDNSGTVKYSVS